jgi:hypothetical protein
VEEAINANFMALPIDYDAQRVVSYLYNTR